MGYSGGASLCRKVVNSEDICPVDELAHENPSDCRHLVVISVLTVLYGGIVVVVGINVV